MTTLDTLRSARELISDEERWCQGAYHKDGAGRACPPEHAQCHCATGALWALPPMGQWTDAKRSALTALYTANGGLSPERTNDTHTHAEVMALFDRAIEDEEKKG